MQHDFSEPNLNRFDCLSSNSSPSIQSTDSGFVTPSSELNFQYRSSIKQKRNKRLWAVEFNNFVQFDRSINHFVALGATQFSIFESTPNGTIKLLMCFKDPDANEDFLTCCWSIIERKNVSVLLTAGKRGVIRIFQPYSFENDIQNWDCLIGHTSAVNQLKISSRKPFLLASASSDRSIRLWNIETCMCIATFHGDYGHRDTVLTIDFNHDCSKLVSGGHDHKIAIWDLSEPKIALTIERSHNYDKNSRNNTIKTVFQPFPIFSNRQIHHHYIDCVQWHGDMILSKSTLNDFYCWKPIYQNTAGNGGIIPQSDFEKIVLFDIEECIHLVVHFATNIDHSIVALGDDLGNVHVWNLDTSNPEKIPCVILDHPNRRNVIVRHLCFSQCGRDLIFCDDDGTIWLYQSNCV